MKLYKKLFSFGCTTLLLGGASLFAVEVTGVPGSPSATTTIDGKQLPPMPDEKFGEKFSVF